MMGKDNPDWYRSDTFFTDRRLLVWEYPATGPKGDQLDVVESSDIENGLIAYHRVYWGWRGYELLTRHGLVADVNPRSGSKAQRCGATAGIIGADNTTRAEAGFSRCLNFRVFNAIDPK